MVLHVHRERTDNIDLVKVANEFVEGCDTRLTQLGRRFTDVDRGNATGTAGTATAVPNIYRISSGWERLFYFVGHVKNLVGFPSHIPCLNSS